EQYDRPEKIYSHPSSLFVADFTGFKNLLDVTKIAQGKYKLSNGREIEADDVEGAQKVAIRPGNILVDQDREGLIEGTVKVRTYLGDSYQYEVETELGEIVVKTKASPLLSSGDRIKMHFPKEHIRVLSR
ncbi:MAG: TOBE domain-containing protein, partial [Spirochaetales bacterium]|nr:TOBE domain-containing protein [Spirochaetales bacterium]